MRPKKLRISGLNSFVEEQVIDFEKLTGRGLFGIFGPTGSGKSTILDAITIAMYGKIARDTREFINSGVDAASISYEFEIGRGSERKAFVVERNIKRDLKGGYKTAAARLRDVTEGKNEVISEGPREVQESIIRIVGLSADDFTRSVVLPQGKFNEFLKLTGVDRRNMLERIFSLEKYGIKLVRGIRNAKNDKQKEYSRLEGELNSYSDISEEAYEAAVKELENLQDEEKVIKQEKKELDREFEISKYIWEKQQELKIYLERKKVLDGMLQGIEEKRMIYKKAQSALAVKPFIDGVYETESKMKGNKEELDSLTGFLKDIEDKLRAVEGEYNEAHDRKDKELPVLIGIESRLQQADEILTEIEKINNEVIELRKGYEANKNEIGKLSTGLENIDALKEKTEKRLQDIEKRLMEIRTDPEYKEKVQAAFDAQREYTRVLKDKTELEGKILKLNNEIKQKKIEYAGIIHIKDENTREVERLVSRLQTLEKSCPGDSSTLLDKKSELDSVKIILNDLLENGKKKAELEKALSEVSQFRAEHEDKLKELNLSMDAKRSEYEKIRDDIDSIRIKNMASTLAANIREGDPCPVCGSSHHPHLAEKVDDSDIKDLMEQEKCIKSEIDSLQLKFVSTQSDFHKCNAEEQVKSEELKKLLEKLDGRDGSVLITEVKRLEDEFSKLNLEIQKWNGEKKEVDKLISECREAKSKADTDEARAAEGISKDEILLSSLDKEAKAIYMKFDEAKSLFQAYNEELKIEDISKALQEIGKNEREIAHLLSEEKGLKDTRNKCDNEKNELQAKINELKLKKAQIEESGKEKAGFIRDRKAKVDELSEGRNVAQYLAEVRNAMSLIKETEAALKKEQDDARNNKQIIQDKQLRASENELTLKKLYDEQMIKLRAVLMENSFENKEVAMDSLIPKDTMEMFDDEIKKYKDDCSFVIKNIDRVNKELQGKSLDEKAWEDVQEKVKSIAQTLNDKAVEIGAIQQRLKDMGSSLEIVKALARQKKELEHSLDLLEDLDKLVQGNRFVEYVAISQLKYIAAEASRRLKDITRGRYGLELDSSGNFVMRDDFNGGSRRSTDTLSGGETFLTSLSLALALSSQIQLKGSAPLEFFFLDEGFGTLDSELLEIVISSLERLHNDKLSVGIISHVEELKNRVPVKLIVSSAVQGGDGSKVEIEYS